jgi:hypothetical protein
MGGESTQAPLAIAVIGGLTFSTTLTLFFIPILYTIFEERFKRKMQSDEDAPMEIESIPNQTVAQVEKSTIMKKPAVRKGKKASDSSSSKK